MADFQKIHHIIFLAANILLAWQCNSKLWRFFRDSAIFLAAIILSAIFLSPKVFIFNISKTS